MKVKMKIIRTIIGLLLFLCNNVNAQNIEIGIAAGFNISSLDNTNSSKNNFIYELSPIATYNLNGFLSFKNRSFWGFSIEPGIIRKGWNQSYNSLESENKLRVYYLQMPILSDFYLSDRLSF